MLPDLEAYWDYCICDCVYGRWYWWKSFGRQLRLDWATSARCLWCSLYMHQFRDDRSDLQLEVWDKAQDSTNSVNHFCGSWPGPRTTARARQLLPHRWILCGNSWWHGVRTVNPLNKNTYVYQLAMPLDRHGFVNCFHCGASVELLPQWWPGYCMQMVSISVMLADVWRLSWLWYVLWIGDVRLLTPQVYQLRLQMAILQQINHEKTLTIIELPFYVSVSLSLVLWPSGYLVCMKIAYVYFRHHHRNTKIQMTRIMNNIILQNHPRCRRAMTIILLNVVPNSAPVLEKTSFFHSLV